MLFENVIYATSVITVCFYLKPIQDSISTSSESHAELANLDDSYANMFKDADKLKLMLLAWNYQNSTAVRNGSTGPDLATMTNLWEQYQNALANNTKSASNDHQDSPVNISFKAKIPVKFSNSKIFF